MEEEMNELDVEAKEQISNLMEAIEHVESKEEQTRTALTVSTVLVARFAGSLYAAIGACEAIKKALMELGKELYK